jgi:hypothetical protein
VSSLCLIFGRPAYEHVLDDKWQKLDSKTHKCIFVGYGEQYGVKGYYLYDQTSCQFFMSKTDIFYENVLFPAQFAKKFQTPTTTTHSCV